MENKNEKTAKKNLLRKSSEASGLSIKGHDFNKNSNLSDVVKSFESSGFQASQFSKAIKITNNRSEEHTSELQSQR